LSEVERLCDQVGIIRDGQVIESGTLAEMRHLTRTQFVLETKQTIPNLVEQPGIHDIEQKAGTIHFQVDTEYLSEVMAFLAPFEITRLESTPPTLEDLFMRHLEANRSFTRCHLQTGTLPYAIMADWLSRYNDYDISQLSGFI